MLCMTAAMAIPTKGEKVKRLKLVISSRPGWNWAGVAIIESICARMKVIKASVNRKSGFLRN